jgi:ADP-heptose:LPS heptosyltransferase
MIQILKKKLKMSSIEPPQTMELASLEKEKETFKQEALNYKAKVLQLEKEKESRSQGHATKSDMVIIVPSTIETRSSIDGFVQAMSQVSLKTWEIKSLKEVIEKLQQEMKMKEEKMAQFQKENQDLQERVNKLKTRLKGKVLLQGDKHVIWDVIVVEATWFRVYLNFINDKDNMDITAQSRCTIVNETLVKKPSEWAQNAIDLLNSVPTTDLQTIGVKDIIALIIWARRIITNHTLLKLVQTKVVQMEQSIQDFKDTFE